MVRLSFVCLVGCGLLLAACHQQVRTVIPAKVVPQDIESTVIQPAKPSAKPEIGNQVTIHYTCWIADEHGVIDRQVQTSYGRQPLAFRVGVAQVIAGLDLGVRLMNVGEKRRLVIPPSLAYGSVGYGVLIPPSVTLVFEVELLSIA